MIVIKSTFFHPNSDLGLIEENRSFSRKEHQALIPQPKDFTQHLLGKIVEVLERPLPIIQKDIENLYNEVIGLQQEAFFEFHSRDSQNPIFGLNTLYKAYNSFSSKPLESKIPTSGKETLGVNGSYFILDREKMKLGVFKPEEEEYGMPKNHPEERLCKGINPGTYAVREKVAFILGKTIGFHIPQTFYITMGNQVGSFQLFAPNKGSVGVLFQGLQEHKLRHQLPEKDLQLMTYFDAVFGNTDRHNGNVLVNDTIAPIDHGNILSTSPEDPLKMEYFNSDFPQLLQPIHQDVLKVIMNPPLEKWKVICKNHGVENEAVAIAITKAIFFQKVVKIAQEKKIDVSIHDLGILSLAEHENLSGADEKKLVEYANFLITLKSTKISNIKVLLIKKDWNDNFVRKFIEYPGDSSKMRPDLFDLLGKLRNN